MTFTCYDGYEFRGDPVALPSQVPWVAFGGAEYYLGRDSSADSWQAARVKCQALGGDLASITSLEIQTFLTETFQDLHQRKWIGGRLAGPGTYQWVNGVVMEFKHFSSGLSPKLECMVMKEDDGGKWEDEDCMKYNIDRFICERESSKKKRQTIETAVSSRANVSIDLEKERKTISPQKSYHFSLKRRPYYI